MGLSSGTLIHQTEFSSLKNILIGKAFKVSYSVEEFGYRQIVSATGWNGSSYTHVFPMVSFSEIPINSLQFHLNRYGDCIIGMKKPWAISKGLNPVHYCHHLSVLSKSLIALYRQYDKLSFSEVEKLGPQQSDFFTNTLQHIEYQLAYTKNYNGVVKTKSYEDNDYIFSEEKEWRFVPLPMDKMRLTIHFEEFKKNKDKYQSDIGKSKLNFNYEDLSYIIVNNDTQKNEIIDILNRDVGHFHTNVFTTEEVKQSFFGYKNSSIEEYKMKVERNDLLEDKIQNIKK